jgi:dTDP-4-dehydrorhamnose 3,5-epimerase
MKLEQTPLQGLQLVHAEPHRDARGSFQRLYCERDWSAIRPDLRFVQVNLSTTLVRGTVRGLHYQSAPASEAKLICCVQGRAWDVAVDLRAGSSTFLQWHAIELDAANPTEVFIPEGFAHGFQCLSDDVRLLYFHTAAWTPGSEGGLRHDDPRLAIGWPLPPALVSDRDRTHPLLDDAFMGLQP